MIIDGEIEIGINKWNMEDELLNGSFQIKPNTTQEIIEFNERNEMERNLQTLHVQRKIWKGYNRNAICWAFYFVNENKDVDPKNLPVKSCLFCYNSLIMCIFNPNIKE
jgi:hypothetical protein